MEKTLKEEKEEIENKLYGTLECMCETCTGENYNCWICCDDSEEDCKYCKEDFNCS